MGTPVCNWGAHVGLRAGGGSAVGVCAQEHGAVPGGGGALADEWMLQASDAGCKGNFARLVPRRSAAR
ncbi:MAG: hypothetical protein ACI9K2_003053 [Myxococcota bacterium]|jgi:hypothetical protein